MSRRSLPKNFQWWTDYYIFHMNESTITAAKYSVVSWLLQKEEILQNIQWSADYYRKKKYYKIFSDQLTITERRNITEYTRTGKKISDKPTKTETRNITEPTITRFKFLVTRRLLQKKRNITQSTITGQKCLVTDRLLQKWEI